MHTERVCDDGQCMSVYMEAPLCYANAVRRALMLDVWSLAIDYVTIAENVSCMPNEMIAHRIGMIPVIGCGHVFGPVKMDEDRDWRNCVRFALHVRGRDVDSGDLCGDFDGCFVQNGIGLSPLSSEQQVLRLEAEATLGNGRQHARWNCAVAARCTSECESSDKRCIRFESTGAIPRDEMLKQAVQGVIRSLAELRRAMESNA